MKKDRVPAWDLEQGDRILGTDLVVDSVSWAGLGSIGSDAQRQRYRIDFQCGKSMTVSAEYRTSTV